MGNRDRMSDLGILAIQIMAGCLAERNIRMLAELDAAPTEGVDVGSVSIVVPARDEAQRLPALLASLARLRYPNRELIVVDDGSTDGTGDLASAAGARVIRLEGPPPGWTGKCYACHIGAQAASGEWLLFVDADTVHAPASLGLALAASSESKASLLSLLPRQRCQTFWERLLVPYAHALYFVGAIGINQPGGPAIANGQYLLFRRSDYQRIGGHEAVRGSVIEDVMLARLARDHGLPVILLRADEQLEVRMYEDLPSLWEGFGKNAFRFMRSSPLNGALTVIATVAFSSALPAAFRARSVWLRLALLLAPAAALVPWMRRFRVPIRFSLLHPLAAGVFQLIALDSVRRTFLHRGTLWKGRRY